MDLHNGQIEVESPSGEGSTIRLLWPLAENPFRPTKSFRKD
jgi:signal transduction histidine kinase